MVGLSNSIAIDITGRNIAITTLLDWILSDTTWNDNNFWVDSETWND